MQNKIFKHAFGDLQKIDYAFQLITGNRREIHLKIVTYKFNCLYSGTVAIKNFQLII